tara:strand:- start:278 stop:493 length:216 start_codon:yes stop_codon:yes gene_type:complete
MDVLVSAEGFKVLSWFIIFAGIFIVVFSQLLVKYVDDKFSKNALRLIGIVSVFLIFVGYFILNDVTKLIIK